MDRPENLQSWCDVGISFSCCLKCLLRIWKDGSVVKYSGCPCWGPGFSSQLHGLLSHSCNSSFRGSNAPFWPSWALHAHATLSYIQARTHTHKVKIKWFWKVFYDVSHVGLKSPVPLLVGNPMFNMCLVSLFLDHWQLKNLQIYIQDHCCINVCFLSSMCACVQMSISALGSQKSALDTMELQLQAVISLLTWGLGTELSAQQEQCESLTTELSLQLQQLTSFYGKETSIARHGGADLQN